ncbi:MAG TPA: GAF and ANTAR domain-containing protein [Jiangellaceae bacterium]
MITAEQQVRRTFVELADTLVADYDIIAFLDTLAHRVTSLLDVAACGLVVADQHDTLNLIAATTEDTRMLELMQLQNSEGPCLECYQSGSPVQDHDLAKADGRWPRFAPAADARGFRSVHAFPMRLRDSVIGAMNLFRTTSQPLDSDRIELGQALADVATIGIMHARTVHHYEVVTEQLQLALNSRIVIEQAKGILVERLGISIEEAFSILRQHARTNNNKLSETAHAVVDGRLHLSRPQQ